MKANSKKIFSNQTGVHENLEKTVLRHLESSFLKPINDHTRLAFDEVSSQIAKVNKPIVLDACCGVGDSSRALARQFPDHWVVGVDKSASRLSRERDEKPPENLILVRADLNDFYRLAAEVCWQPSHHFVLYPNPWPKAEHLKRRWHGAPVFPYMLKLGGRLELRSNWRLYLEEFRQALVLAGHAGELEAYDARVPITPFEAKYKESGQALWRLTANLS
ncbi:tRNA (guanine(46)-N(7))-methyltransferase TrmB [Kordiimonas sp.]|uniref:tRNA (guanine(46)-N(7))-methyltransferase TrmB n=1 Tax=Kordiimonas sp. TaxID=1970157 RepID=UPI003A921CD8